MGLCNTLARSSFSDRPAARTCSSTFRNPQSPRWSGLHPWLVCAGLGSADARPLQVLWSAVCLAAVIHVGRGPRWLSDWPQNSRPTAGRDPRGLDEPQEAIGRVAAGPSQGL